MRIKDSEAFNVCDIVETDFSGMATKHIIAGRFKVAHSQTGVVYEVIPPVPKSGEGQRVGRLDHAWFKRIGKFSFEGERMLFHDLREQPRQPEAGELEGEENEHND